MTSDSRNRWFALVLLCMGSLMIVLDTTIVNVALPSIRDSLHFSQTSLAWVVNAYMLTFGGFLLLGGRLGDHFGHRRLFVGGITLFTLASLACGLSSTDGMLVAARAVQGFGGAIVSAVSLSLIVSLFVEPADRQRGRCASAKLVMRFGTKRPLVGGLTLASVGLAMLARTGTRSFRGRPTAEHDPARVRRRGCLQSAADGGDG